jgi:hypothetical protein
VRALLLVVLSACWGTSQPAPAPEPTPEPAPPASAFRSRRALDPCKPTIDRMSENLRPEISKMGLAEPTIDEMIEAAIDSCRAAGWSTELIDCFDRANDMGEINACQVMMTQEQSEDLSRRMMDVVSRMSQQQQPPP